MSVWRPDRDGRWPQDVALDAPSDRRPGRVLEVGCGTGAFAARVASELACRVIPLDLVSNMAETARARGLPATVGDVRTRAVFENRAADARR